jgi:hypothetical protein
MSATPIAKCPFLVVVRGGEDSLHRSWIKPGLPRRWDLLMDLYGSNSGVDEFADFTHSGGTSKFPSVSQINSVWPGYLLSYDAVWFVDGDISIAFEDVDRMFDIFVARNLWLAQPSLSRASFRDHEICVHRDLFVLRHVSFVEIMAPIFSRAALSRCLPTFGESVSGWGLDFVWPEIIGDPQHRLAIIDAVQMVHTKKTDLVDGPFYRMLSGMGIDPKVEAETVAAKYGVRPKFRTYSGVLD